MAGIYIHIPFCKSKCIYCDFYSTTTLEKSKRYVKAIKIESEQRKCYLNSDTEINTIYFGGGTPSLLSPEELCCTLDHIKLLFKVSDNAEITLEGNPDDLNEDFLLAIRKGGFNRLSMGIQSFNDDRLKFIRRRHSSEMAKTAIENARKAGFENISIDLIYGFPNETLDDWKKDIDSALKLSPEHISAYALMFEEGTHLWKMLHTNQIEEIDEELSLKMYETLIEQLESAGYQHYEISNFCKPNYHSRHNSSYWEGTPYIGIGAAAHSYDGTTRQWNPDSLDEYLKGIENNTPIFEKELLTPDQKYDEYIMTGLRTYKGISLKNIEKHYGTDKAVYCRKNALPHIETGHLEFNSQTQVLRLTRKGIFVSDYIISDLMAL
jgi:oxygen-independent coproporphyrinogen-3 oxidase